MTPFEILTPTTLGEARSMLMETGGRAAIFAGGTDALGEMKQGTAAPSALVNIGRMDELRRIEDAPNGTAFGSMVTLAEIANRAAYAERYPAFVQAAQSVATPQIRNVGTLGGNLCQRPRCWYYRSAAFHCLKKGGDTCFAVEGGNKYHAIFGADRCHIVHPSDTAVALMALDAEVEIFGEGGLRRVPIAELFVGPGEDILSETSLGVGDILTCVVIPNRTEGSRSLYIKAKERQAYDFALVSVAGYVDIVNGVIEEARLALGGVSPTPYFAQSASDALRGSKAEDVDTAAIGALAVEGAEPMSDNRYKARLASNLVSRAVETLLDSPKDFSKK